MLFNLYISTTSSCNDNCFYITMDFVIHFRTGTGKGGKSIWGSKFEDEFHDSLRVGVIFLNWTALLILANVFLHKVTL